MQLNRMCGLYYRGIMSVDYEDCGIYNNQSGGQYGVVGPPQGGGYDSGLATFTREYLLLTIIFDLGIFGFV